MNSDRQTNRQTDPHSQRNREKETDTQKDRHTERQTHRETDRQTRDFPLKIKWKEFKNSAFISYN